MKPFKNCFSVDIHFSHVGYMHALEKLRDRNIEPSVLWVAFNYYERAWAEMVLRKFNLKGICVKTTQDYTLGQWSLGNYTDYGYGSLGY
jgi:hypothetical protein